MTNRARWLILFAIVGLIAGALRGQVVLALLSLSACLWVLVEWLRFQARLQFELPRLHFERRVNGRADATGSLWASRKVQIEIRVQNRPSSSPNIQANNSPRLTAFDLTRLVWTSTIWAKSKIEPVIHVRDIVPEIMEVTPTVPPEIELPGELIGKSTNVVERQALKLFMKCISWYAKLTQGNAPQRTTPNEWTLDSQCREGGFRYVATLQAAGAMTLPGLRLIFEDQYGFFRIHRFVKLEQSFRILPDYFQSGEVRPTVKRHNSLPRHGIHRLQRAGAGSELLELREYVPGDPPKSIAWKVSARRNQLMTRKYESEVPVRVHLFIDGSPSTRNGGYGRRLLDQINYVAASVAKAAIAVGDPVGGMLVDEKGVKRLTWMAGDRGFMQLLKALADFAQAAPPVANSVSPYMMQCAIRVCYERYPELLDRRYLRIPFSFRAATRERFRIASVLAELNQLSPREHVECYYDDTVLAVYLQKFLFAAGLPWMAPLFAATVDPAITGARSMRLLSEAMSQAIAHARDNEVFVVLADPLGCAPNLMQLLRVVKLAIVKHHRVAFIFPTSTFARPQAGIIRPQSPEVADLLLAAEQVRARDVAQYLKRELVRLGVAVAFSGEQNAIRMVLAEIDLARRQVTRAGSSRMNEPTAVALSNNANAGSPIGSAPLIERTVTWQTFRLVGDVIQWLVLGLVLDSLLFAGTPVSLTLQMLIISVLLFMALRWSGWIVLVAIQVSLFFREPGSSQMLPGGGAFLYCAVSLLLIAHICHAKRLRHQISRWLATQMILLVNPITLQDQSTRQSESAMSTPGIATTGRILLTSQWLVLAGVLLLAMLVMRWLPITSNARLQWLQRSLASENMLWPGATSVVLTIGLLVVVREAAWRQLTAAQASLCLRCSFVLDHFQDLRMLVLRRLKVRNKARGAGPAPPPVGRVAAEPQHNK